MIKKIFRFTSALFEKNFRRSRRFRSGNFVFLISNTNNTPRFAVVAGKRISRSAVKRNRLRRQLYALVRKNLVPYITSQNIICLYNGPEILHNTAEFEKACHELLRFLSSPKHHSQKGINLKISSKASLSGLPFSISFW
ncbi:ribonuclease P protein component [Candidatus Gracilibacteria bacterium]|nr:ribonuclease P protein component [Candidatus Gracilibacteria bacterium]